jgi:hypothetical protein
MDQAQPKRVRGPDKAPRKTRPKMKHISMRLPHEVADFFGGSTIAMRDALEKHVRENKV